MKVWLRGVRSTVGMGLIWAAVWFSAGMVLLLIVGPDAADVPFPVGFGLLGLLAGVTFSGVQALIGKRRMSGPFGEASMGRFVVSGAVAGLLFAVGFVFTVGALGTASLDLPGMAVLFSLAGAVSAAASLSLARWGERRGLL